ncbi:MAG: PLP-dependent aminotransferase family protein [Desulfovibrio sp.]|uniref:aminotransferase-like domain-containing protein n=1 Tax=Desulfovibrio sp. 7SRBS1 TaxID=3378064 RepID=UPI003B3DEB29
MQFAQRMSGIHRSYIREILKVTANPEIISFAGGLPNPKSFPTDQVAQAAQKLLTERGPDSLQYSTTEGFPALREFIANRYRATYGLDVGPDNILITTGSQQGLDLLGKIFLNRGSDLILERPGYLGAIQCFSLFGPNFLTADTGKEGIDIDQLEELLKNNSPAFMYCVPNFQNPSGVTYTEQTRKEVARLSREYGLLVVEDNPYGELRFMGEDVPPIAKYMDGHPSVMLGTFSKIVSPGMRVGWVCAPEEIIDQMVTAKQASDLHSSTFNQLLLHQYLSMFNLDDHIETIRTMYREHRNVMVEMAHKVFPDSVSFTEPEGGMFLWAELPKDVSAAELFDKAIEQKVAFVPGKPFYVDGTDNTFRLNFSNAAPEGIREGMTRLGRCLEQAMA